MTQPDPYPIYTVRERVADGVVHAAGIVFAVTATILLLIWARGEPAGIIASLWIYGVALSGSFVASACYHFTPWEHLRPTLRRIDHAAIYIKIAGTYTPLVVLIGSGFAYGVLALVWALALIGALTKLFFWQPKAGSGRWGTALYVGLGWLSVALITSLVPLMPPVALGLIVAGGLIYSLGAVVFSIDGLRFQNAIWHGFVLTASVCFCVAIAMGIFGAT